jgi:hypothetical protein
MSSTGRPAGAASIRSAQWILFALAFGVGLFAVVAAVVIELGGGPLLAGDDGDRARMVQLLGAVIGVTSLGIVPVWFLMRARAFRQLKADVASARADLEAGRLPGPLFALKLIGATLVEAPGLLGCVAFLLTGNTLVLAAPALAIVLILLQVPTRSGCSQLARELDRESY